MAVLKNKTQGNYTLVSQNIMRDRSLSLTERGMLLTLLSLPDSWQLTIKGLCQILPDGKDKVSKTLNSLIDKGYITREQSRDGGGKFDSTILEVHETPVIPTEPTQPTDPTDPKRKVIKEFSIKPDSSPCPEKPDAVNPHAEKPCPENPPQYINNISNNYKSITKEVCSEEDTLTDSEYEDLVSEFGKGSVDYQIQRIKDRGYRGCLNYETIKAWCKERQARPATMPGAPPRKNAFCNFEQRNDYDFEELERQLLCN
ncbi:helix-turn-helix domain-containing protein [Butyrivibrio sp. INlla16]|uniref:helix-turn-helix domain-containing protein n=1 Tax=Butyrivibrio sp. INlla16 TaxID=1520807 RepID=UPI000888937E|nr:helix-turn-helix domain-containing protein [Butyrivibrio sp. INlla16]SDB61449.1 hypothetical protein SAMN02910263_03276 [Butyrivibrio sp. INlla16]